MTTFLPGPVDVHAHWLPAELFGLPPGAPYRPISDRDGQLFIGDIPLSIDSRLMSDVDAIRADMEAAGIAVRVLSAPPFAFARHDLPGANEYTEAFNTALSAVVRDSHGAFAGFGSVNLGNVDASARQIETLRDDDGIVGIAIPPIVGDESLDVGALRDILRLAARADLAVLVHPMQLPAPAMGRHYLTNLIGNPTESAVAVASTLLGGVMEELPELRICFVHGGGCAPDLLGRWDHAWHARPDVSAGSRTPPSEGFRQLYFDTVTHDELALALLSEKAGDARILIGSDYPFDMADNDPLNNAIGRGLTTHDLDRATRQFLRVE
ncbi:MAG: amidohydrolase [Microbacterium sp.]|nr:amidohydrolase [Microbacterium sp.]